MDVSFAILLSAVGIAFVHTLLGVDHTLPFIALAKARSWSMRKTLTITAICGIGHVLASLLLGMLGIALGWGIGRMEAVETGRGPIAAWVLIALGAAYCLWGIRRGWQRHSGLKLHRHGAHLHLHRHGVRNHQHGASGARVEESDPQAFWVLFAIFILGPCEPLIPLFILPASQGDWGLATATALTFATVTLATMLVVVALAHKGLKHLRLAPFENWAEALAGGVIAASGLAIVYLGV